MFDECDTADTLKRLPCRKQLACPVKEIQGNVTESLALIFAFESIENSKRETGGKKRCASNNICLVALNISLIYIPVCVCVCVCVECPLLLL